MRAEDNGSVRDARMTAEEEVHAVTRTVRAACNATRAHASTVTGTKGEHGTAPPPAVPTHVTAVYVEMASSTREKIAMATT